MSEEKQTPEKAPAEQPPRDTGGREMKECFGVNFGWYMEGLIGDTDQLKICYHCPDYDACHKMAMHRAETLLRMEIREAAQTISRAFGGSHSKRPFG